MYEIMKLSALKDELSSIESATKSLKELKVTVPAVEALIAWLQKADEDVREAIDNY